MESFFFFVLVFLPQGKRCCQAETQSFKNGLLSGDFFKTPAYVFVRKVRDAIVFHSLYPFRVQGQKRGIRYMSTRIFSKTEKKNIRFFRLDTCGHGEGLTSKNAYQIDDMHLRTQFKTSGRSVSGTFIC